MQLFEVVLLVLCSIFVISGIDDLFIDLVHMIKGLSISKHTPEEWKVMKAKEEQPIAIMVPAWNEFEVLGAMIRTNIARIQYHNYKWFIGVYPNDEKTFKIADSLAREFPGQVNVVVVDKPGPTSKAHCLNNIISTIRLKSTQGWAPHYLAIHDAEDVVHPQSLIAINSLKEQPDFIQLPIFSLPRSIHALVGGTYLDEFAENHLKEIPAREALGMPIPSAGVGTFFSWTSLDKIQKKYGYIFQEKSLTEDYELSMRIADLGATQKFLVLADEEGKGLVATREYFPDGFMTSIRQKTRWVTGITLQSSQREIKSLAAYYGKFRDRKGLITNLVNLLGWLTALYYLYTMMPLGAESIQEFQNSNLIYSMMAINFGIFIIRLIQRARFTYAEYGVAQGLMGIPRVLISNVVNSFATIRAIYRFTKAAPKSKMNQMEWDKTTHQFPTAEVIQGT